MMTASGILVITARADVFAHPLSVDERSKGIFVLQAFGKEQYVFYSSCSFLSSPVPSFPFTTGTSFFLQTIVAEGECVIL